MADQKQKEALDKKIVAYFDTLDCLYNCQQELQDQVSSGFLNLSKARYTMGVKAVGAMQFDEREITAVAKVDVTGNEDDPENNLFVLVRDGTGGDNTENQDTSKVRQRQKKPKSQDADENFDDMDWINEQIKKMGIGSLDGLASKPKMKSKPAHKDPLKWFGVLVPQTLRASQTNFQNAIELAVEIANLRNKLLTIKQCYEDLSKGIEGTTM